MVRVVQSKTNIIFVVLIIYCIIINVAYCDEKKPEVNSQSLKDAIQNQAKPTRTESIKNVAIAVCINAKSVALWPQATWDDVVQNPHPVLANAKDNICCTEYINYIVSTNKNLPILYFICNKCSEYDQAHNSEKNAGYEPKNKDQLCTDDEKQDAIVSLKDIGLKGTKIQNHNIVRAYYEPILAIIEKHELAAKYVEAVHKVMPREIEKDLPTIELFIDRLCGTAINTEEEKPVDTPSENLSKEKSGTNLSKVVSGIFTGVRRMAGTNLKKIVSVGSLSFQRGVGSVSFKKAAGNLTRKWSTAGNLSRKQSTNQPPPSESTNEGANQPPPSESTNEGANQPPPDETSYDEYHRPHQDRNVSGWTGHRFHHDYVIGGK